MVSGRAMRQRFEEATSTRHRGGFIRGRFKAPEATGGFYHKIEAREDSGCNRAGPVCHCVGPFGQTNLSDSPPHGHVHSLGFGRPNS